MSRFVIARVALFFVFAPVVSAVAAEPDTVALAVRVDGLRNSQGVVLFSLYNQKGSIPDEKLERTFRQKRGHIKKGSAWVVFKKLPKGRYAVVVLHDEDNNGKVKKGLMLPTEGVGFSNYKSFGPLNRPTFEGASFEVRRKLRKRVQIIYF